MELHVQLLSFGVSFCYGIFFYLLLELNSRVLYSSHKFIKVFGSILFILFHVLLYFLILMKINYGYVHIYFFLCILGGYLLCKAIYKRFVKKE